MVSLRDLKRRLVLLTPMAVACLAGCVERRYTIRTNPPGALVVVNDEEMGPTPLSSSFTYYGDREIKLMRDGYMTKTVIQPIKAPWYDNYLTEFFTENLIPFTFRDEREFTYDLEPYAPADVNALMQNGENLRAQAQTNPPPRRGGILGYLGFP